MSAVITYAFDPTGSLAANKISHELQILTPTNWRDYQLIVPTFAPFFMDSVQLIYRGTDGTVKVLTRGIDWYESHQFIGASRGCSLPIYGSITFLNNQLAGTVELAYQTLGGDWVQDQASIAQLLADRLHNPRITAWEQVAHVPYAFPVIDHAWDLVDMVGAKDLVAAIQAIEDQLRQSGQQGLAIHIADKSNPHGVTKDQVGLSNVANYPPATKAQAQAGTDDSSYLTPLTGFNLVDVFAATPLAQHIAQRNPHGTTPADIGTYSTVDIDTKLNGKLDKNAVAYDSQRLGGMLPPQLQAWVLQGTAANAQLFGGKTYLEVMSDFQGGASANALQLAGLDLDGVKGYVLGSGTAYDSARFGGVLYTDFMNALASTTTVFNASHLENQSLAQVIAQAQAGTAANSNKLNGKSELELTSSILTGTAANALKMAGYDVTGLTNLILAGTAANTTKFMGKAYADVITDFTSRDVNNALHLQGMTADDLKNYILSSQGAQAYDTQRFGGVLYADFWTAIQNSTVANANTLAGQTLTQILSTVANSTVANASALNGKSETQLTSSILSGTAANSAKFAGYNLTDFTAMITAGTVANANKLGGMTVAQLTQYVGDNASVSAASSVGGMTAQDIKNYADASSAAASAAATSQINTSGNAHTATQLQMARMIGLNGDIAGSGSFDGTSNLFINTALSATGVTAGTYGSNTKSLTIAVDAKGRVASVVENTVTPNWSSVQNPPTTIAGYGITDAVYLTMLGIPNGVATLDANGLVPATQLPSYVDDVLEFAGTVNFPATGETGKIYVDTTTNKTYRWSGTVYIEISASPGSTDAVAEGTTNLYFTAARAQAAVTTITGNAGSATKLATARTLSATGDATGSMSFDGSANSSMALTLANSGATAGTYGGNVQTAQITVDAKGRVTSITNMTIMPAFSNVTGKPTTLAGYGITDAQALDSDLTAIAALGTTGLIARTASGAAATRTLTQGAGIAVTNGDGVSGNPTIALTTSGATAGNYGDNVTVPSLSVDTYGRITGINAVAIRAASTTQAGIVQLSDSTSSASSLVGATSAAVKSAYDLATSAKANATTANALQTARVINGTAFDGSANITFHDTFTAGTASPAVGTFAEKSVRLFTADNSTDFPSADFTGMTVSGAGNARAAQLGFRVWNSADGLPSGVYFRTNDNLNGAWGGWSQLADIYGNNATGTWGINVTGSANSAYSLATPRTFSINGDGTASASFNGTANAVLSLTLANTGVGAGTYGTATGVPTLTVDSKGRVTGASTTPIQAASTTQSGVVQLSSAINSTSTTLAATASAVKSAYDLANSANTSVTALQATVTQLQSDVIAALDSLTAQVNSIVTTLG